MNDEEIYKLSLKDALAGEKMPIGGWSAKIAFIFLLKKLIKQEKKIELLESYINHMEWRLNEITKNKDGGENGQTKTED